jgi:hypothetical protein
MANSLMASNPNAMFKNARRTSDNRSNRMSAKDIRVKDTRVKEAQIPAKAMVKVTAKPHKSTEAKATSNWDHTEGDRP